MRHQGRKITDLPETLEADAILSSEETGRVALRVFKGDRSIVHIIENDTKKVFEVCDKIEYWKWLTGSKIVLVAAQQVY